MSAYDTLLSANRREMLHGSVLGPLPAWCEPEAPFTFAHRIGGRYESGGQYRLTTYARAKIESGDWKAIPEWYHA